MVETINLFNIAFEMAQVVRSELKKGTLCTDGAQVVPPGGIVERVIASQRTI